MIKVTVDLKEGVSSLIYEQGQEWGSVCQGEHKKEKCCGTQYQGTDLFLTAGDGRSKQHFASTMFLKGEKLAQQLLAAVRELRLNWDSRSLICDNRMSPYSG